MVCLDAPNVWNDALSLPLKNKVTWIQCILLHAFSSFRERFLQDFVGFFIAVHIKILCYLQYVQLILWYLHCVLAFQFPTPSAKCSFLVLSSNILSLPLPVLENVPFTPKIKRKIVGMETGHALARIQHVCKFNEHIHSGVT